MVAFARDLIRTSSFTGSEGKLAELVQERMRSLSFDDVFSDEVGNVIGRIRGSSRGRSVVLVSHLDTSPVGPPELWSSDPFGGEIDGTYLHGLGAASNKAAIAAQVFGGGLLARGLLKRGEVVVACVVDSERGACFGIRHLFDETLAAHGLRPNFVIMGDPTSLGIYLGHRGRVELEITTVGRTSHASSPWLGLNAAYKMIPVLEGIEELARALPSHPFLEKSTVAVTGLLTGPEGAGLIPDRCIARIDRRFLPGESLDAVVSQLQTILNRVSAKDPEFRAEVRVVETDVTSYTGMTRRCPKLLSPWLTHETHPLVGLACDALSAIGETPRFDKWYFATDGSYPGGTLGLPTIGFGPGEERYSHTPFDRVRLDYLWRAGAGAAAIAEAVAEDPNG